MASKDRKTVDRSASTSDAKITRIRASDDKKTATKKSVVTTAKPAKISKSPLGYLTAPFVAIGRYFAGAWYELRQVRWPNRRATWSLTGAMLVFTAFFVVLILLLDALFKYLFQLILG